MVEITKNSFKAYVRNPIETRINSCEKKAKLLKKLRTITNEIMSNDIYCNKNMELQQLQIDKLRIPQWKKDISDSTF